MSELDFQSYYAVEGMPGVAWYLISFDTFEYEECFEWIDEDGENRYDYYMVTEDDPDWVIAVMVGDDRRHKIEVSDLVKIDDDDFCFGCGQIGCNHGG